MLQSKSMQLLELIVPQLLFELHQSSMAFQLSMINQTLIIV